MARETNGLSYSCALKIAVPSYVNPSSERRSFGKSPAAGNGEVLLKLTGKPVLVIRQLEIGSSRANLGILQKATRRVVLVSSERPFF